VKNFNWSNKKKMGKQKTKGKKSKKKEEEVEEEEGEEQIDYEPVSFDEEGIYGVKNDYAWFLSRNSKEDWDLVMSKKIGEGKI
jgi:hypothetical protein